MTSRLEGLLDDFIFIESPKIISLNKAEKIIRVKATSKRVAHKRRIKFEGKEKEKKIHKKYNICGHDIGIVYHGGKKKIDKIDTTKLQMRDTGFYGDGFYVTTNKEHSKTYGRSVTTLKFNDNANILLASLKPEDAPPELVNDVKKDYIDRFGEKAKIEAKMFDDNPINWNQAVDDFAKRNNYDAIKYCEGEIVVKNLSIINVLKKTKQIKTNKSLMVPDNLVEIKSLYDAGIEVVGGIHGSNTFICKFKDGSSAIHKVMNQGDIIGEVGAYNTVKILKWDIIPETIQCDYGKGKGSTQKWIPDSNEPYSGFDDNGILIKEKHLNDLSKIFILDMITGNFDRHDGNIIIDKSDKCWAIDNECVGKLNNAELYIESLEQFVKTGEGSPLPMIRVFENSFGNDIKMYQNFKDHVDKNINQVIQNKEEIIKYWSQYKDSNDINTGIPIKEGIGYIKRNIEYLEKYYGELND